jgi:hypothetical protein
MLSLDRKDEDTFTFISDDANAENATLDEGIESIMPGLHGEFQQTQVEDGELRFDVPRDHWDDLLELVEWLGTGAEIPVPGSDEMYDRVKAAKAEKDAA